MIELQASEHPLVASDHFESAEEFCLFLMHMRAYEEARQRCRGLRVLDLGCNNGYGTNLIADSAAFVVGCDVSLAAIEDARRRYPGIEFHQVGGVSLPFGDGEFDMVASFQVIEHIVEAAPYLEEIRRVLKPHGTALLTTPNAAIRLDPGMHPWNRFHVREYRSQGLRELLETAFDRVEICGLFAAEELYRLEYSRCHAALKRHRGSQPRAGMARIGRRLATAINPLLRSLALGRRRGAVGRPAVAGHSREFDRSMLSRFSTRDMYYASGDLDRALDLLAICVKR
jgi:SAM-dependent methyltransferase